MSRYDDPIWEGGETADITELGALGQVGQQAAEGVEGVGIGKLCKMERGKALNEEEDTVLEEGERQTERGGGEREKELATVGRSSSSTIDVFQSG